MGGEKNSFRFMIFVFLKNIHLSVFGGTQVFVFGNVNYGL